MKSRASLFILCTALLSVRCDSPVASIPIVGGLAEGAASTVGEGASGVVSNVSTAATDGFKKIKFTLIAADRNASFDVDNAADLLNDIAFNSALPTVVYMHGYSETRESDSVKVVSDAFLHKASHNFIFVDWSEYAKFPYLGAFLNVIGASAAVGSAVDSLVQAGLPRDDLWIIGHSLGGQMSGLVSRSLDFKPKRLSALDPALPGYQIPGFPNLTRDDAQLVDVIHTDAGVFGFNEPCGHVDYWPNAGHALQPGCNLIGDHAFCSHHRSWYFFAESLYNETAFPAVKCSSWTDFLAGKCPVNETNVAYLGYKSPSQAELGSYYLKTNDASPFAQGLEGVTVETSAASKFFGGIHDFFSNIF